MNNHVLVMEAINWIEFKTTRTGETFQWIDGITKLMFTEGPLQLGMFPSVGMLGFTSVLQTFLVEV